MTFKRNAFLSMAVADAIGNPFEFGDPSPAEVQQHMETGDLYLTDDTQMAMFGQEGINWAKRTSSQQTLRREVKAGYLRWYDTQQGQPIPHVRGLLGEPLMHRIEAPGTTCLQSLAILKASHRTIRNDRKGCGAVMRLLPFALMLHDAFYSYTQVLDLAQYATALTHGHPEAEAATALYMSTVHALVHGIQPQFFDDLKTVEHITELGTGWTAMECLSMACYAVATSKTYDEMVIRAICHPGDSDSVAAVAGGLWALAGNTGFERFTDRLMHRRIIEELTA